MQRFLDDHLTLLVSTLAASTIVIKIWTVAHGAPAGIAALVSSGGLTSLVGALLAGLPAVGTACLLAADVFLPEAIREGDELRGPAIGTAAALTIGFCFAPVRWFVIGLGLFVLTIIGAFVIVGARHLWMKRSSRRLPFVLRKSEHPQRVRPTVALVLIVALGWVAIALSDRPWLLSEDVTTTESRSITGYVLDDADGLVMMRETDRSVLRIPDEEIAERTVCSTDAPSARSLVSILLWPESIVYPKCSGG